MQQAQNLDKTLTPNKLLQREKDGKLQQKKSCSMRNTTMSATKPKRSIRISSQRMDKRRQDKQNKSTLNYKRNLQIFTQKPRKGIFCSISGSVRKKQIQAVG